MLQPQPQRETRIYRLRGRGDPGVTRDEFLHTGHRAQLLGHGDSEDQRTTISGIAHNTFIDRLPNRMRGITPSCGGNQSL